MDGTNIHTPSQDTTEQFLAELTELSAKHGVAIGGSPVLFLMERPDYDYWYKIDSDSALSRA